MPVDDYKKEDIRVYLRDGFALIKQINKIHDQRTINNIPYLKAYNDFRNATPPQTFNATVSSINEKFAIDLPANLSRQQLYTVDKVLESMVIDLKNHSELFPGATIDELRKAIGEAIKGSKIFSDEIRGEKGENIHNVFHAMFAQQPAKLAAGPVPKMGEAATAASSAKMEQPHTRYMALQSEISSLEADIVKLKNIYNQISQPQPNVSPRDRENDIEMLNNAISQKQQTLNDAKKASSAIISAPIRELENIKPRIEQAQHYLELLETGQKNLAAAKKSGNTEMIKHAESYVAALKEGGLNHFRAVFKREVKSDVLDNHINDFLRTAHKIQDANLAAKSRAALTPAASSPKNAGQASSVGLFKNPAAKPKTVRFQEPEAKPTTPRPNK